MLHPGSYAWPEHGLSHFDPSAGYRVDPAFEIGGVLNNYACKRAKKVPHSLSNLQTHLGILDKTWNRDTYYV